MSRLLALAVLALLVACDSPEAARTRGGGAGADVGNRAETVLMHEGSQPYAKTPQLAPGKAGPSEGANHAHELSRP
ncbi:MAG TPA: hypothetical protein VED01_00445 [Burkholderiales bacterium]|nr:hypothetical protein [Burkholderiales bacterium]